MALLHPYPLQQNQLLKKEMNFKKSDMNHALVKYSTTTTTTLWISIIHINLATMQTTCVVSQN
jgi:hypothetical protein